jgi:hypothetical protein
VVKRLTDALKGESFAPETFKLFLEAFKAMEKMLDRYRYLSLTLSTTAALPTQNARSDPKQASYGSDEERLLLSPPTRPLGHPVRLRTDQKLLVFHSLI